MAPTNLKNKEPLKVLNHLNYEIKFISTTDSLWMTTAVPNEARVAFRLIFSANDPLVIEAIDQHDEGLEVTARNDFAIYRTSVKFPDPSQPIIRYTTTMEAKFPLLIPYWPKDILPLTKDGEISEEGTIHIQQVGTRSGLLFFSLPHPESTSVFYFQNLTALASYCDATKTSSGELVGGTWPEIGYSPPTTKEEPVPEGEELTISDAFVLLSDLVPENNFQVTRQFLDHLAEVYLLMPRPETVYHHWPDTAEKSLNEIADHKGCWSFAKGHPYLNAYVCDFKTPAELMVQLAVLIPMMEYAHWKEEEHPIIQQIRDGLSSFYDEKLGTVVRWLPSLEKDLDGSEEQKQPKIMDAWYLHHPLLNLTRLAGTGDETAKKLVLDSIDYAIKVAQRFEYQWPVFYKMDTLEVVKAETKPGEGGEKDVPGSYAHLMLEVWKLTGEQRFFDEARAAADKLADLGFDIFYQANNTSFASKAMLRLYKETKDEKYLNISYVFIASIFKNVQLWDCNYGYGKNFPTFFAIFPLSDAPYTAAYEEQEVHAGLLEYVAEAEGVDLPSSIRLLIAEFVKYTVARIASYYPPLLPTDMLSEEMESGEIDPKLYVPLEDIHDGWEKSGQVGQEVYGAGIAFGILPRQYYKVPGGDFMVYLDYPLSNYEVEEGKSVRFQLLGDKRLNCQIRIMKKGQTELPQFEVRIKSIEQPLEGKPTEDGAMTFILPGDEQVSITWKE